jgi:hypothetical protein
MSESRFGDVVDVPQLQLPDKFAAECKRGPLLLLLLLLLLLPLLLLLLLLLTNAPDLLLPSLPALHTVAHTALDTQSARLRQGISRCILPLTLHTSNPY